MREIDFVLTDHGALGVGITSPQLPGLVAGVRTFEVATPTFLMALARETAGTDVDGFVVHVEQLVQADGQIFAIRCRQDFGMGGRVEIADALVALLESDERLRTGWPTDELGDVRLIAALPTDKVGQVARSVQSGEAVVAVFREGMAGTAVRIACPSAADMDLTVAQFADRVGDHTSAVAEHREFAFAT